MTTPTASAHEAAMLVRAVHEGRPLAVVAGVPETSLAAARELARWAGTIEEPGLALAMWEGCAALDDAPSSWLGVAEVALAQGDAPRAFQAAGRACAHSRASVAERARGALISARACLAAGQVQDAVRWLDTIGAGAEPDVSRVARALRATLSAR